ncbi:Hypothetical Protein RradSPS_0710 [Rubrobacter radiotolerans]|uniref:Uncharacterized protein n=1 Tax=Rubrobacter radiotolerans TaxID=42256 RepID=A0A023X0Z4_RUBRA|nr:hypothetical protein [Rubrobacter radiotolerans]AHY45993.1 Hypothetical Protein RradSPS_0710 [Rubrobacter radiotolerans]MDX5893405.1 hypothetical protein [Rubrobacter radiotolerans]SMC03663.1 hypothetical protein SAMN00767673_0709 [Rubrobacter radiotolerans DSM 5868]
MKPNTSKNAILAALLAVLALALAGCWAGAASTPETDRAEADGRDGTTSFAGRVEGTDAFVAVVVNRENRALAYVCDGQEGRTANVAEWFTGTVAEDGSLELRSENGAKLSAQVSGDGTEGTVQLPGGEEYAFSADPAEEPAGLYRAEETVDGEEYVGGWIQLPSGEERGAVKNTSSGFVGGNIELARPSKPINGFIGNDIEL